MCDNLLWFMNITETLLCVIQAGIWIGEPVFWNLQIICYLAVMISAYAVFGLTAKLSVTKHSL